MVFDKQIVGRTLENIAKSLKRSEFDTRGLVVVNFVEVLITESELNIKPVFALSLLL